MCRTCSKCGDGGGGNEMVGRGRARPLLHDHALRQLLVRGRVVVAHGGAGDGVQERKLEARDRAADVMADEPGVVAKQEGVESE